ncbi:MAG: Isoquinoline 1-oxidoreductase subunit, partial [Jannaschia sp.]
VLDWALPPSEMQWALRGPAEICAQLKDPERNGGRTLAEVADHVTHDPLVLWGWEPGPGRAPAPGTPAALAEAILAWDAAGAPCP